MPPAPVCRHPVRVLNVAFAYPLIAVLQARAARFAAA